MNVRLIRRRWRKLISSTLSESRKSAASLGSVPYSAHLILPLAEAAAKPAAPPATVAPPYQFGQPDTEATIVIAKEAGEPTKQVKYATMEKAVEYLTFPFEHCPGCVDCSPAYEHPMLEPLSLTWYTRRFGEIMLYTYPMFMTSTQLLALIALRYTLPPRCPSIPAQPYASLRFQQTQDLAIKAQTVEVMRNWVETNFDWAIEASFGAFIDKHKDMSTAFRGKGSIKTLKNVFELHKKVRDRCGERDASCVRLAWFQ